jgi:hypothetical protein
LQLDRVLTWAVQVVLFYDSARGEARLVSRGLQLMHEASTRVPGFRFVKCDTSSVQNRQHAEAVNLAGGTFLFSRTVDDGVGE